MRRFFLKLLRRRRLQQDLETELAFHRDMSSSAQNPIPLGNSSSIKEQALDLWRFNFLENLWRDTIYSIRGLRRSPALVASALLSLGLGIGVNTAIFSLGVEFLFSEPSVRDGRSLVSVRIGGNSHATTQVVDFLRASGLFEEVTGENEEAFANYNDGHETHRTFGVYTSKNYFSVLGVPMLYGRGFIPSDSDQVVVLQYRFWRKYFNGERDVIGRAINLDGRMCTVVGILPEDHRTPIGFGFSPDLFLPNYLERTQLAIYARMKPGMTLSEAFAGLQTVAARMDREMPRQYKFNTLLRVTPMAGYARLTMDKDLRTVGVFFGLLLAITSLVLLIACVNVASLLLARGSARRGEIAVRLALGAGRGRLLQQMLTESILLALAGAALGVTLSQVTATLLARVQLPLPMPIRLVITPDWRVTIYAALLTTAATLACGLLPALQSLKESIAPDLQRERRMRLRRVLVVAQIAGSVVVLTTGFLFLRNLVSASSISPGFDVVHTLRVDVSLPARGYDTRVRRNDLVDRVLRAFSAVPGIGPVAAASIIPFNDDSHNTTSLSIRGGPTVQVRYSWNAVTADYFGAMSIPILQGSTFPATDRGGKVVVVNSTFVERYLGGREGVGTLFTIGDSAKTFFRIVGVVAGTKTITIGEEQQPQLYEPLDEAPDAKPRIEFVMHSSIPPALQLESVRREMRRIEPMAGVEVATMYSSIGLAFLPSQIGALLLGAVGVLGLLLATIGLYGVMVYSVTRRTREIGVRVAIGATATDISKMVLRDSTRLTVTGSVIGLLAAFFVTRPLAAFLVPGLKPDDPATFISVAGVMVLTGLVAAWGPMRRALAVDPHTALRNE
jgi:putative ABC transport system permease protein